MRTSMTRFSKMRPMVAGGMVMAVRMRGRGKEWDGRGHRDPDCMKAPRVMHLANQWRSFQVDEPAFGARGFGFLANEPRGPTNIDERLRTRVLPTAGFLLLALVATALIALHASAASETEPNNDLASSNPLVSTGSYTVFGNASASTDSADFYRFNLTSPSIVEVIVSSSWGCTGAACENLTVYASNGSVLISPFGKPMSSTDVYFSGLAGSYFYVKVAAGSPGGAYS